MPKPRTALQWAAELRERADYCISLGYISAPELLEIAALLEAGAKDGERLAIARIALKRIEAMSWPCGEVRGCSDIERLAVETIAELDAAKVEGE